MINKTPNEVEWRDLPPPKESDNLPFATHEGVLNVLGKSIRCYRLSNGMTVFSAEDLEKFWGDL
jgi:hypothetical protein